MAAAVRSDVEEKKKGLEAPTQAFWRSLVYWFSIFCQDARGAVQFALDSDEAGLFGCWFHAACPACLFAPYHPFVRSLRR